MNGKNIGSRYRRWVRIAYQVLNEQTITHNADPVWILTCHITDRASQPSHHRGTAADFALNHAYNWPWSTTNQSPLLNYKPNLLEWLNSRVIPILRARLKKLNFDIVIVVESDHLHIAVMTVGTEPWKEVKHLLGRAYTYADGGRPGLYSYTKNDIAALRSGSLRKWKGAGDPAGALLVQVYRDPIRRVLHENRDAPYADNNPTAPDIPLPTDQPVLQEEPILHDEPAVPVEIVPEVTQHDDDEDPGPVLLDIFTSGLTPVTADFAAAIRTSFNLFPFESTERADPVWLVSTLEAKRAFDTAISVIKDLWYNDRTRRVLATTLNSLGVRQNQIVAIALYAVWFAVNSLDFRVPSLVTDGYVWRDLPTWPWTYLGIGVMYAIPSPLSLTAWRRLRRSIEFGVFGLTAKLYPSGLTYSRGRSLDQYAQSLGNHWLTGDPDELSDDQQLVNDFQFFIACCLGLRRNFFTEASQSLSRARTSDGGKSFVQSYGDYLDILDSRRYYGDRVGKPLLHKGLGLAHEEGSHGSYITGIHSNRGELGLHHPLAMCTYPLRRYLVQAIVTEILTGGIT